MPIYVYQVIKEDGSEGEIFEVIQSMHDNTLERHPETNEPIQKIYSPPNLASKYTPGRTKTLLDNKNVEKAGFVKYEKDKLTGNYHKVAGKQGPDKINRPS